jgi:hypothetical protein
MSTINASTVSATNITTNSITVGGRLLPNSLGSIIQTVYVRSDAFTTYSVPASGDGTTISALGLSITPSNANNRIICNWMINAEVDYNTVFLVHRNGVLITTVGEEGRNSVSNNGWVGFSPVPYDGNDQSSTMSNMTIQYSQIAGTTNTITYAPAIRSSNTGVSYTFFLNRCIAGTGGSQFENAVSTGILHEVVV